MTIQEQLTAARTADYVTAEQLALLLGVSPDTIWRRIRRQELPGVIRYGLRGIRIHRETALATATCSSSSELS